MAYRATPNGSVAEKHGQALKDRASSTRTVSIQGTKLIGAAPEGKVLSFVRGDRDSCLGLKLINCESHGTLIVWFWPPQFPKEAPNSKSQTTKLRSHVVALWGGSAVLAAS